MTPAVFDFDMGVAFMKGYGKTIAELQIESGELIIKEPEGPFLVKSVFSEEIIEIEEFSDLVAFFDYEKSERQVKEILAELQTSSVQIVDPGFVVCYKRHKSSWFDLIAVMSEMKHTLLQETMKSYLLATKKAEVMKTFTSRDALKAYLVANNVADKTPIVVSTYKHRVVLCEELIAGYKKGKEDVKKTET